MENFFTWSMLATYAGATLATNVITQLFKGVGFLANVPTRLFSYVVALAVLLAATLFDFSIPPWHFSPLSSPIRQYAGWGLFLFGSIPWQPAFFLQEQYPYIALL